MRNVSSSLLGVLVLTITVTAGAQEKTNHAPNYFCSQSTVAQAEVEIQKAKDLFRVGEYTKVDVQIAETLALDAKLCAGKITLETYCASKPSALEEIVAGVKLDAQVGGRSLDEVAAFEEKLANTKETCFENKPFKPVVTKCDASDVKAATMALEQTIQGFKVGETTKLDVRLAKTKLQDLMVCSGDLGLFSYCKIKPATMREIDAFYQAEKAVGTALPGGELGFLDEYLRAGLFCTMPR